jgi:hypothetical protein
MLFSEAIIASRASMAKKKVSGTFFHKAKKVPDTFYTPFIQGWCGAVEMAGRRWRLRRDGMQVVY